MKCPVLLSSGRPPRPGARAPRAAGPRAAQTLELHMCPHPHLSFSHTTHHSGKFTQSYTGNNDQPAKRLASSIPERQRGNNAEQYFINKECIPWGLKFTVLHASRGHGREIITLCLPPKLPRSIRPHWNMRTCTLINKVRRSTWDIDKYYSVHPRPRNALGFLFRAS